MISRFDELNKLFQEIDSALKEKVHFFVIGGAMMLYHGLKPATKDIDIIVETEQEYREIRQLLLKLSFKTKAPSFGYGKVEISQIFIREDFRLDIFNHIVCEGFCLSPSMEKRATHIGKLKHLTVSLLSQEDVLLFKTFTERDGDIDDCMKLARLGLNWDAILEELKHQIKASGNKVWLTHVTSRLEMLEDKGLPIPIMGKISKMVEEFYGDSERKSK